MRRLRFACAWVLACGIAAPLGAQSAGDSSGRPIVRQLQQRMAEVVQRRLRASDDQMRQLAAVNGRYDAERRSLAMKEREARAAIRAEVLRDSLADQNRVARSMDALTSVQRQRLELFAREQQDLARFLTPVQRAKYATLQAHLRKRVESLRERRQENRLSASERRRLRALRRSGMSAPE
jgi:hypothetical protein